MTGRDGPAPRPGGVHRSAGDGYRAQATSYRRARPAYHPALARRVAERHRPDPADRVGVVEIGAGTGIFTRQLLAEGLAVTAVEPVAAMRQALVDSLPATGSAGPGPPVHVVDGTAEGIPVGDGATGTVVVAQAFHWFDHGPALDEIARVLADGGHLVTVWNVRDERIDWVAACTEVIDAFAGDTPRHRTMAWRRAIDRDPRFELVDDLAVDNPWPTSPAGVADRVSSTSFIGALDADTRASVLARIARIVEPLGPTFDYPYRSELQAWRYRSAGWNRRAMAR